MMHAEFAVQVYTAAACKRCLIARRPQDRPVACVRLTEVEPVPWAIRFAEGER